MSLIGALNVGTSALTAAQTAIQVTGNNIANAGNADYSRQTVSVTPAPDQQLAPGIFIGDGVDVSAVQRQVDDALETRLRSSVSDNQAATTTQQWLTQVESTFNALSGQDLSSQMSGFFGAWSNLANNPSDSGLRQVVLQDGDSLAQTFNTLNTQLTGLQSNASQELGSQATAADSLTSQVAALNGQIVTAENGNTGTANSLRDQRDAVLKQLAGMMNIQTVEQPNGVTNVYVGSDPLVVGTQSNGVAVKQATVNGVLTTSIVFKANNGTMNVTSGTLGALQSVSSQIQDTVTQVNGLAHNLIFELNKLHSSGQGLDGFTSVTATNAVADPTVPLNNPASGMQFPVTNGSFVVHVQNTSTGLATSTLVPVPVTGGPGDATLNSIVSTLNAISGVSATITGGKLQISSTNSADQLTFSQDTSGVLAGLGINTFYSGTDASNIALNSTISADPQLLAAAKNGNSNDNQTALSIAALASQPLASLQSNSLTDAYQGMINTLSNNTAAAGTQATAAQAVQSTLESQRDSLSGVSLDQEMVNLMQQQTAYQGAARLISTVNQMLQDLMAITI